MFKQKQTKGQILNCRKNHFFVKILVVLGHVRRFWPHNKVQANQGHLRRVLLRSGVRP